MSEPTSIPVSYSPWTQDPETGILVSIVTRTDTGEVIGSAEKAPIETTEDNSARASGLSKLTALGLTEEEINALLG